MFSSREDYLKMELVVAMHLVLIRLGNLQCVCVCCVYIYLIRQTVYSMLHKVDGKFQK